MMLNLSSIPPAVVEMLQSLHSLQQENQRLQDQILSLTAKKERLQLLNTELAVPFPPHIHSTQGSMHTSAQINFLSSSQGQVLYFFYLLSSNLRTHSSYSIMENSLQLLLSLCPCPPSFSKQFFYLLLLLFLDFYSSVCYHHMIPVQ